MWCELGRRLNNEPDDDVRRKRQGINRALKALRSGEVPGEPLECRYGVPADILAPFDAKRTAAREAALATLRRKVEATPIDDAAWDAELQWRQRIDARITGK